MTAWTLIAGGRSIAALDYAADTVGTVVAVNRAWFRFPQAPYWSASERPVRMWGRIAKTRALLERWKPTVWAPASPWAGHWRGSFPSTRVESYRFYDREADRFVVSPGWRSALDWANGTTTTTLALMCQRGARSIRLLGVDHEGVGGWGNDAAGEDAAWWSARWAKEGANLRAIIAEAAEHGVAIEWRRAAEVVA